MTGFGLPWDQKGYWAKQVETSIAGSVPLVGAVIERVIQGGGVYGNYTVTRLYSVHVFVLPALVLLLLGVHLYLVLRHRLTPHWSLSPADANRLARGYWPRQAFRDAVGSTIAFLVVVSFVLARRGADLEAPGRSGQPVHGPARVVFDSAVPAAQVLRGAAGAGGHAGDPRGGRRAGGGAAVPRSRPRPPARASAGRCWRWPGSV